MSASKNTTGYLASFALFGHQIQEGEYSLGRRYATVMVEKQAKDRRLGNVIERVRGLIVQPGLVYSDDIIKSVALGKLAVFGETKEAAIANFKHISSLKTAPEAETQPQDAHRAMERLKSYLKAVREGNVDAIDNVLQNLPEIDC